MKKCIVGSVMLLLCMGASVSAQYPRILWVSDAWQDAAPRDAGFINVLTDEGYTVDRLQNPRTMNTDQRDLANTYDLVIVGRYASSGEYINAGERDLWNSITTPLINMNAFICRSSHWRWLDGTGTFNTTAQLRVIDPDDPIFGGVVTDQNGQVGVISQGSVSVILANSAGNGTLVAIRSVTNEESVWIARWETGMRFYPNSDQIAGGPRMYFPGGEAGGNGDGVYNFTEQGKTIFLNAVYELSGATFNRKPVVNAGSNRIVYVNDEIQLGASVFEPDGDALTLLWTPLTGQGNVTISDDTAVDPVISFSAKGTYTLELSADDGDLSATNTVTVYVRDPADDRLLSHWDFEGLPDPNILIDRAGNFNGVFHHNIAGMEPNTIPGHMSPTAVDFSSQQWWDIPGTTANVDPNYYSTQSGLSIAAWVKIESSPILTPSLISYDLPAGWRFQVNDNRWNLSQSGSGGSPERNVFSIRPVFRPQWQHVVAVYDGVNSQMKIYIDGILDNTAIMPSGYLLGIGTMSLRIGNRADGERLWPGMVDDIRVYNYALSDDDIIALAAAGDRAPLISAGPDQTIFYKGEPIQMQGVRYIDDGLPGPLMLEWSVVSVPFGVDPDSVIFADLTDEATLVEFPTVTGNYTLKLSGDDGAVQVEDEVIITLVIPTCADVVADGLALPGDLSGPDGVPDCVVDIHDFAVIASNWLNCNDPMDVTCIWPY